MSVFETGTVFVGTECDDSDILGSCIEITSNIPRDIADNTTPTKACIEISSNIVSDGKACIEISNNIPACPNPTTNCLGVADATLQVSLSGSNPYCFGDTIDITVNSTGSNLHTYITFLNDGGASINSSGTQITSLPNGAGGVLGGNYSLFILVKDMVCGSYAWFRTNVTFIECSGVAVRAVLEILDSGLGTGVVAGNLYNGNGLGHFAVVPELIISNFAELGAGYKFIYNIPEVDANTWEVISTDTFTPTFPSVAGSVAYTIIIATVLIGQNEPLEDDFTIATGFNVRGASIYKQEPAIHLSATYKCYSELYLQWVNIPDSFLPVLSVMNTKYTDTCFDVAFFDVMNSVVDKFVPLWSLSLAGDEVVQYQMIPERSHTACFSCVAYGTLVPVVIGSFPVGDLFTHRSVPASGNTGKINI